MRKIVSTAVAVAAAAVSVAFPAPAFATAVVSGFNTDTGLHCDDCATGAQSLGFTANFFGNNYSNAFVSSNGYVTFNSGQTSFTPAGLGATYSGQPIIAAFFADVDNGVGPGIIGSGTGTFDGHGAFGATWNSVGYFNDSIDKTNTFQILLVDRGDTGVGNFDIVLNYDQIQWESGDVESPTDDGFGGNSASAGFNAGRPGNPSGTYFEFTGSHTPGSFLDSNPTTGLANNSNVGVTGRYVFNVREGDVIAPPPVAAVPEPATWAMMLFGFGATGVAFRRNRKRAIAQFA
jgi:hypothetical protein